MATTKRMKTTTMTTTMVAAAAVAAAAAKAAQRLVLSDVRRRQDPDRALRWDGRLLVAPTGATAVSPGLLHAHLRDTLEYQAGPPSAWLLAG